MKKLFFLAALLTQNAWAIEVNLNNSSTNQKVNEYLQTELKADVEEAAQVAERIFGLSLSARTVYIDVRDSKEENGEYTPENGKLYIEISPQVGAAEVRNTLFHELGHLVTDEYFQGEKEVFHEQHGNLLLSKSHKDWDKIPAGELKGRMCRLETFTPIFLPHSELLADTFAVIMLKSPHIRHRDFLVQAKKRFWWLFDQSKEPHVLFNPVRGFLWRKSLKKSPSDQEIKSIWNTIGNNVLTIFEQESPKCLEGEIPYFSFDSAKQANRDLINQLKQSLSL